VRIRRKFALNFTEFVISKLGVMEKKVHEISKIETPPGLSKKLQEISEDIETLLSVSNGTKKIVELTTSLPLLDETFFKDRLVKELSKLIPKDIKFEAKIEKKLPAVSADGGLLIEALSHLTINSIESFEEKDDGKIILSIKRKKDNSLMMILEDNGCGINNGIISNIFVPFYTTKIGHAGIGLNSTLKILSKFNGTLHIESEPSLSRTMATIELPPYRSEFLIKSKDKTIVNILMVEDEYKITEFISKSLVKYGYNIKIASNLEEARLILKNEGDSINLIFIDVVLPDGDGRILGEEVSKLYPNIKIILNNSVYSKNEIKARDMEFDFDFIQEPYKIENIMGEIEDYINGNFKV